MKRTARAAVVLTAILLVTSVFAACADEEDATDTTQAASVTSETSQPEVTAPPPEEVRLRWIVDDPVDYYGFNVLVEGVVDEVLSPNLFTIIPPDEERPETTGTTSAPTTTAPAGPHGTGQAERVLLIAGTEDMFGALVAGDRVQVVGTVSLVNVPRFENVLGTELDESLLEEWENRPGMVALSVIEADVRE